jgi:hypothetical protein
MTLAAPFRRALALVLLLAVGLLAEAALVSPWLTWRADVAARTQAAAALLARTWAAERNAAAEAERLAQARAGQGLADAFLPAAADGLASAQLQTLLRDAAAAAGIALASLQAEPVVADAFGRRVALRVGLRAGFPALLQFLLLIEGARPVMRVRSLEVQVVGPGEDPELSVSLEVAALMLMPPA